MKKINKKIRKNCVEEKKTLSIIYSRVPLTFLLRILGRPVAVVWCCWLTDWVVETAVKEVWLIETEVMCPRLATFKLEDKEEDVAIGGMVVPTLVCCDCWQLDEFCTGDGVATPRGVSATPTIPCKPLIRLSIPFDLILYHHHHHRHCHPHTK